MPEHPEPKARPHPWREKKDPGSFFAAGEKTPGVISPGGYVDLHVSSNFSFLRGASHPEELVAQAAALGHEAVAITDVNTLAGIVRAHVAAKESGIRLVVGCRLAMDFSVLVFPTDRAAYGRLCRLLTLGKRRAAKGECDLGLYDLVEHNEGLLAVVVPPVDLDGDFVETLAGLRRVFDDDRLSIATSCLYGPDDGERMRQLVALSQHTCIPLAATNDVHYHEAQRRPLQDVLTSIRLGCTVAGAGLNLFPHAERHLKPASEMTRLFAECTGAVDRTVRIARRATFNLDELRYQYPQETCPPGRTPIKHLAELTRQGSLQRYPDGVPGKVRDRITHELGLIDELDYARYFLTVHDLVVFAKGRGILCQGRGAAANSAVCYCLGITAVDPDRIDMLFERFVSRERNEPPDIDIDFEHERREEVIQYIYRKYGRDRAALTGVVVSYRGRSAVREIGKALGLSLDCVDRLARSLDWWDYDNIKQDRLRELGLNPDDPTIERLFLLLREMLGFPRHLSQHVGGFVITKDPLCELVPIENAAMPDRTVIEWDKDDIDAMGMLKVDVLGLGMLTCIRKSFELIDDHGLHGEPISLYTVPPEDPAVYDMVCAADTVGVFQIESRAQMSMLPRLRPRCFYDLVIEVAIVRPGPIQGKMVHPYLRRRNGEEPVSYPSEDVRDVLSRTLGIPLFQEQAMKLAIVAAGFTPDEADQLRRSMAAWRRRGDQMERFGARLVKGMIDRGYPREFAERCFEQIKGFSEYGFPESHAASFALLVYVSCWLKRWHPAVFAAALINSQPMGFYAPAQIVRDAREHGVEVREMDVSSSRWDCTLEERHGGTEARRHEGGDAPCHRLGMRLTRGLREDEAALVVNAVARRGPFRSIAELWRASGAQVSTMRRLASADAFRSMGLDRQAALWEIRALSDEQLPLFEATERSEPSPGLPRIPELRKVIQDYVATGLSLKAHPVSFCRDELTARGATPAREFADKRTWPHGSKAAVAGIVLVRQRPGTASGIVFMTLEDETGTANLIVRPKVYRRYRRVARHGVLVLARGTVERQGDVVHILVESLENAEGATPLATRSRDFR